MEDHGAERLTGTSDIIRKIVGRIDRHDAKGSVPRFHVLRHLPACARKASCCAGNPLSCVGWWEGEIRPADLADPLNAADSMNGGFKEAALRHGMQWEWRQRAGNVDNRSGEAALRHAERVESRQKAASALIAPASAECVARWLYAVNFPNYPDLRL